MESNEEDASSEMDISGDQRQMDDEFKMRVLTLGKMEQRTAQAFYSKKNWNRIQMAWAEWK